MDFLNKLLMISMICLLIGCGGGDKSEVTVDGQPEDLSNKKLEFRIIERYADLTASESQLVGVWESDCYFNNKASTYSKELYAFHLDGVYYAQPLFNDAACSIKSSRVWVIYYGFIENNEAIVLTNGADDVEVQQLQLRLMIESRRRVLPVEQLSIDDLQYYKTDTRAFKIIANRLYTTDDYGPNSANFLTGFPEYYRNKASGEQTLSEAEIDQVALDTFGQ